MSKQQREEVDAILRAGAMPDQPTPEELRAAFAAMMAKPLTDGVRATAETLGDRPAVRFTVEPARSDAIVLYFHGGSFVFGSPETAQTVTAELVRRTGVPAVSLDYRLAPEHPFPAAIKDGLAAYRELLENWPADRIVLAGDSAGGGLTVTTMLAAREAGLPLPAGAISFSGSFDATGSGPSMISKEEVDPIFTRVDLAHVRSFYLAGQDPAQPLLSAAVHADLSGLPPLLLQVGTNEVLLDDSTRLATRAAAADVDVILDVTADVPHVFQTFTGLLDEADDALDRAARFITDRLAS